MQASDATLSRKSRGILFQLKSQLNQQRKTLKDHVCELFGFEKTEYNKKDFSKLIRTYDTHLVLSELDQLFDELDDSRNGKVFLYTLKQQYESIAEADDPAAPNSNRLIRTAQGSRQKTHDLLPIFTEVRALLLSSPDVIEIVHLLGQENGGIVTAGNLADLLSNLDYNNPQKQALLLSSLFPEGEGLPIDSFLEMLDLNDSARRSSLKQSQLRPQQDHSEVNQSQYIRNMLKDHKPEQSISISMARCSFSLPSSSLPTGGDRSEQYIGLENIPESLRPYFNYGSELEHAFAHVARDYIESSKVFIDTENPLYSQAYQWIHLAEKGSSYFLFQMAQSVLVRQRNRKGLGQLLEPKDIIQGSLGDCYFLSAVAGVVEKYPELIYRLFVLEKNPSHLYGVRLFIEGSWRTVLLDACFPVNRAGGFCGAQPHHQEIWVMLLEKAWAKVYGSYDNIHSGYNEEGLNAISGAPSIFVTAKQNEFVRRVEVELRRGSILTCATSPYVAQMSKNDQDRMGIYSNHAYSLLNVYSGLRDREGREVTLLRVRNPWGKKQWQGRWGFKSDFWTSELRKQLEYEKNPHDGSFFMSREDFITHFEHVNICRVNLSYSNSWVELQADRQEFKAVRLTVRDKGDYYFTIYQQNPRRYAGRPYEKSKSWMFLLEQKGDKLVAVGSSCKDKRDNTLEASLERGEYLLVARVQWKEWQSHSYCLSSYGPERIFMQPEIEFNVHWLSDFIESKARLGFGKKSFYNNANILKRVQFSPEQGYGFILVNNQQNVIFDLMIRFDTHKGLTILPPYRLPIHLQIFPGEEVICKFLVDPSGYSYSLKESYDCRQSL